MPLPFPRNPEVEAAYQAHRHALEVRRHLLERDAVEHARIERQHGVAGRVGRQAWVGAPPSAERFAEQRLQFVVVRMALGAGRPPPDVRIVEGPEIGVERRGRVLLVHRDVPAALTEQRLYALVAHALFAGRLRSPARHLPSVALGLLVATGARIRHRVVALDDRVYRVPRLGLTSALMLVTWLPLAVATIPLLVADVVLRAVVGLWRRPWIFRADRLAVGLVGSREHLVEALRDVDALAGGETRALEERPGDRPRWRLGTPALRARSRWARWLGRWGIGEPSAAVRTRALEHPTTMALDLVWSVVQVAAIAAAAWGAWGRAPSIEWPTLPEWPSVEVAEAPVERLRVRSARGCHVREGGGVEARSLGVVGAGVECEEVGPPKRRWRQVRCGAQEGYMHRNCLE